MNKSSLKKIIKKSILRVLTVGKTAPVLRDKEKGVVLKNATEVKADTIIKKERKKANPEGLKDVLVIFNVKLDIIDFKDNRIISVSGLIVDKDQNGWFITAEGKQNKVYDYVLETLGYYMSSDMYSGNVVFTPQMP